MKLFEQFSHRGYHASVMTTFGIDFDAYENVVLHKLRNAGCNNNLVIADAGMIAHALATAPELPRHAGRQYSITGVRSNGVFHPKVILQLGRKTARLFVSSANLTAPGIAGNLEVIGHVAASPEHVGESRLLASAWQYLARFIDMDQEIVRHQVALIRERTPWLMDAEPADSLVSLANGEGAAFIDGNGQSTIASRFVELIGGDVRRLIVVSPYWDEDLKALRALQNTTGAEKVCILVGGSKPSFPSSSLAERDAIRLYALEAGTDSRFVHGKVVIAQTREADHVLYGSANCTVAGLGAARNIGGRNDEACLYRRMPRGGALRELRLENAISKEKELKGEKLPTWRVVPEIPADAAMARSPGRFEVQGTMLHWWPSAGYDRPNARVELLGHDGDLLDGEPMEIAALDAAFRRFAIADLQIAPSFARVRVDEEVSIPAVVVIPDILRRESREARSRKLEAVADRLKGQEPLGIWILEFIDLIAQAEADEIDGHRSPTRRHSGGNGNKRPTVDPVEFKPLSYEEFIAGRHLREEEAGGASSGFAGSDLDFVRNYLNRMIGHGAAKLEEVEEKDDAPIRAALKVKDEADAIDEDDDVDEPPPGEPKDAVTEVERLKREEDAARRAVASRLTARGDIAKHSIEFCDLMACKPELTLADMLRLRAVLMVMLGSCCAIGSGILDTQRSTLQVLRADGPNGWPRLIGRVLSTFFSGTAPAISRLHVDTPDGSLPVELIDCFSTCFWATHVCRIAADGSRELRSVKQSLDGIAVLLYRRSGLSRDALQNESVTSLFAKLAATFPVGVSFEEIHAMHLAAIERVGSGASSTVLERT